MSRETDSQVFPGGGEIGTLLRDTDWARTPLGPVASWPCTLVGYVRMILELPTPAVIFWGPERTQLYNAGYATIMGPRHPAYFGAPYREAWPETYRIINPWMRKVLDHGEFVQVQDELMPIARHGFEEEAYFSFTFSPLRDDAGRIVGIYQPVFEVTDRVLGERRTATLRAVEVQTHEPGGLQSAVDALATNRADIPFALFYLWDAASRALTLAGQIAPLGTGEARLRSLAQRAFEANDPLEIGDVDVLLGDAHPGPWPEATRAAFILPLGREGALRGVAVFGISPRLHFDEKYRGFLELAAAQVVARVALEEERAGRLREAERRRQYLGELFTQAPVAIAVLRGPDHVFELTNPLYRQLIGEHREVLGEPVRVALPEIEGQIYGDRLDEVYRTGRPFVGTEMRARLARGEAGEIEEAFFDFVYQPMHDSEGAVEGVLVFAYDVTDQVRARRRVEALAEELKLEQQRKDEFLAMLAHELRNPLAALALSLTLMERPELGEARAQQFREAAGRQVATLARLVDDLLDVSRLTRGRVDLACERVELGEVIRRALDGVQKLLEDKRHDVRVDLPREPVEVVGDPVRLEQVLVNLLTNAGKYTDAGGRIAVTLRRSESHAEVRVADNGIGIEPELIGHVFSLFGQGRRGLDRSQGGLGIGLTIVRHLVEQHGGTVEVQSEGAGRGSEFIVTLPLAERQEEAPGPAPVTSAPTTPRRVLVVDDNVDAAESVAVALELAGHEVFVAHDGPSALVKAEETAPDCILLDIGLPGMDGYEVARRLRQNPRTRHAALAAITGYGQPRDREQALAAGFDRHFVKPVGVEVLEAFVGEGAERS